MTAVNVFLVFFVNTSSQRTETYNPLPPSVIAAAIRHEIEVFPEIIWSPVSTG